MADINNKSPAATFLELQPLLYNSSLNSYTDSYNVLTTSYLTAALALLALAQIYYYFKNYYEKKVSGKNGEKRILGLDDIPGPTLYLPKFIGCMPKFLPYSNSLKYGYKWYLEYPGLAKTTGAGKTFVGFTNGPLLQQLFKSVDFGHGVKAPVVYANMKPFITNGVLVSTGKFWQTQRKTLLKSQSFQSLKAYMEMLNKHSETFVGELEKMFEDGQPHQINGAINILFLKVICEMITGYNVEGSQESQEFNRYHHNFQIWKESLVKRILYPWFMFNPLWKLHPMSKLQGKAVGEMIDFARRRMIEHKEKRARGVMPDEEVDSEKPPFRSVLDELLDAGVEDDQIIDEVNTMIFGGHETGATAIHFFCFCMALNPDIQELCCREIDELFENPDSFKNGSITYEALQSNLRYLERCILETLRLYPPVFLFLRELKSPLRVEQNNNTYELPVGVNVIVCPFVMHRDPVIFPEPEKFDPDRFLPDETAKRHAYSYIPFSGGSKNCLGQKFAMMEMKIVAAYLLRRFELRTTDKMEDIPLLPFITLTPERDYTFQFKKRDLP